MKGQENAKVKPYESSTYKLLFGQPLYFDIHTKNTGGWGGTMLGASVHSNLDRRKPFLMIDFRNHHGKRLNR
jgi:hypothetical protein